MTKTEKTIAGTWYTITCTAAVTVTQEIDGEIATLATLEKSGTTTFRASASTITIQTEGKYHILPTKAPAALVGGNGGGGESGAWVSDTVPVGVRLGDYAEKTFVIGSLFSIAGELVPGGKLKRLLCSVSCGSGKLWLRQRVPSTGELVTVGYGTFASTNVSIPGTSSTFVAFEFDSSCELVAGRELVLDVVESDSCFIYATGPAAGCSIFGKANTEAVDEWYDGWLVPCYFELDQERRWRVSSTGEPVMPQLGDKLTVCNATWFDNTAQSSISVQAAPWKNEVMTCYLKTAVPVKLSGVTWLYGEPAMMEGFTFVIALQQVDASTVLANLAYSLKQ